MGRRIDALLGRRTTFASAKFKALVNLAVSRLTVLKNQRQVRCSQARSDVVQLLNLGHHERALLRVEQVIKEQNMLDVFVMMEGYCLLLMERVNLIEQEKSCPHELNEAISSLLYAASRCGEFPELQEIRAVFTSRYGKEFAARAIELRNNCGVNANMIQKLSTRTPSLESRLKVLKEIASENGIVLQLEEASSGTTEEKLGTNQNQSEADPAYNSEVIEKPEGLSGSVKKKYRDVADAAQAAFESAAHAAAAARAAVELSRSEPRDPDDQNSPNPRRRKVSTWEEPGEVEEPDVGLGFEKIPPNENYHSETEPKRSMPVLSSDSEDDILNVSMMSSDVLGQTKPLGKEIDFDESDNESTNEESSVPFLKTHDLGFDMKPSLLTNTDLKTEKSNSVRDEDLSEGSGMNLHYTSHKQIPTRFRDSTNVGSGLRNPITHSAEGSGIQSAPRLNLEKKPISVRTRRRHVH